MSDSSSASGSRPEMSDALRDVPAWMRRYRAARVSLPTWAADAPQRCAYATNASGAWQVMSWDLGSDEHVQITDKETGVLGGRPTPDGTGVVWFDDHAGDEVGRYVVTPFAGGAPTPFVPEAGEGWSAGLSIRPERLAIGVSTSDGFVLSTRDADGFREVYRHTQPAGVSGLSKDAAVLAIGHTERGDVMHPDLRLVDAVTGEVLLEVADGEHESVAAAGWSPVRGDARLALLSDRTGRTRPELLDLATGERTPLELDLPGEVYVADWWPDASALLLGHDHLGRTELHRYDLGRHTSEALDLTTGTILSARVRDDGALWYAFNSSAKPSQIRVRDEDGDRPLLTPPGDPAPEGVAYRSLHYDNGDGDRVHAFLALPREGSAPHPLVVDVHGGPSAQETDSFVASVQAWVDHGFAVLLPNYRGSTGYGKAWEDALQGDPGRPELVDVLAGLRHLLDEGIADPERTVLTGASWGGYLTLQGIGTQPDAWRAAVAVVPVADYVAAYADEAPVLQEFDRTLFGGTPDELPDLYRERSPITYVDRVRTPVLIITGANDTRCPKRQVDNYVAALEAAGVPHAYDVFEAGHGSYRVEETIRQQALAIDFAAEHLGTPPAQREG
jgi:dipeptidyl aminopeptidase/acylaminoacyl peptidase